jgi:hypothetical protein
MNSPTAFGIARHGGRRERGEPEHTAPPRGVAGGVVAASGRRPARSWRNVRAHEHLLARPSLGLRSVEPSQPPVWRAPGSTSLAPRRTFDRPENVTCSRTGDSRVDRAPQTTSSLTGRIEEREGVKADARLCVELEGESGSSEFSQPRTSPCSSTSRGSLRFGGRDGHALWVRTHLSGGTR